MIICSCRAENKVIWQIGENNNSGIEYALSPNDYASFIEKDFGWEDKYFLIGTSDVKTDWPYIIPGTSDTWGGTWSTSGWRSSTLNIFFGIDNLPQGGVWKLTIDILDCNSKDLPLFKVTVNGKSWKYRIPALNENSLIDGEIPDSSEFLIEIPLENSIMRAGGNEINLTTLEGSWLKFDQVIMEGPRDVYLTENKQAYLRSVNTAIYEIETENGSGQPLLVDLEHLNGKPELIVKLDDEEIFKKTVETGRYIFEAPMPAITSNSESMYEIFINGHQIQTGKVIRGPQNRLHQLDMLIPKWGLLTHVG